MEKHFTITKQFRITAFIKYIKDLTKHYEEIVLLSLRKTRISRERCILFLRPAVSIPQSEKIRSTYACEAGAVTRSSAIGANVL